VLDNLRQLWYNDYTRGDRMKKEQESFRKRRNIFIDEKVWRAFQKEIKPTGQSVSRVLETIMRVSTSKDAEPIFKIFDSIFEVGKKYGNIPDDK
jgi:hypothetical protein